MDFIALFWRYFHCTGLDEVANSFGLIAHLVDGFVDLLALVVVDGFSD